MDNSLKFQEIQLINSIIRTFVFLVFIFIITFSWCKTNTYIHEKIEETMNIANHLDEVATQFEEKMNEFDLDGINITIDNLNSVTSNMRTSTDNVKDFANKMTRFFKGEWLWQDNTFMKNVL